MHGLMCVGSCYVNVQFGSNCGIKCVSVAPPQGKPDRFHSLEMIWPLIPYSIIQSKDHLRGDEIAEPTCGYTVWSWIWLGITPMACNIPQPGADIFKLKAITDSPH